MDIRPANMFLTSITGDFNQHNSNPTTNKTPFANILNSKNNTHNNVENHAQNALSNTNNGQDAIHSNNNGDTNARKSVSPTHKEPMEVLKMIIYGDVLVKLGDFGVACRVDHKGEIEEGETVRIMRFFSLYIDALCALLGMCYIMCLSCLYCQHYLIQFKYVLCRYRYSFLMT
jgi:hypothetical protein